MADHLSKAATKAALIPRINIEVRTAWYIVFLAFALSIFNGWLILSAIPLLAGARLATANDDQQFRLWGLWFKNRVYSFNWNRHFWKSSSYTNNKARF